MCVLAQMHLKIMTCMFEQLSKPLKMDGIHISLLVVTCLNFMQKCGNKKMWKNDYPLFLVQKLIFGRRNTTVLSLLSTLILKVK